MNALHAQFIVSNVVTGESGQIHVIGRCGEAIVAVGDVFRCVYRIRKPEYPHGMAGPPIRESGEHEAALKVQCIHAYDKSLRELGAGMTGSLVIVGDGVKYVAPGVMLGQPSPACVES